MTNDDDMGLGEMRRGFERLEKQLEAMQKDVSARYHALSDKMTSALGPVSEVRFRCDQQEKDLGEIATKLRIVEKAQSLMELRAATIGGGVAAIVFIIKFIVGR